jgi:hypothetical protein
MQPRFRIVGDAREQATHLGGGRQFALLLKDGGDRCAWASVPTNMRGGWKGCLR